MDSTNTSKKYNISALQLHPLQRAAESETTMKCTCGRRYLSTTVLAACIFGFAASAALAQRNPERDAYFGETHIHTSWSVDAWVMGNRITGPDDALEVRSGPDHQAPAGLRHQN
jgi:uncharacterized protein DUF3604